MLDEGASSLGQELLLRGHVRHDAGGGVQDARVVATWLGHDYSSLGLVPLGIGSTDGTGAFRIRCPELAALPPALVRSRRIAVTAERTGYTAGRALWSEWPPPGAPFEGAEVELTLTPGRRLLGRVVDASSAPVEGAFIRFTYAPHGVTDGELVSRVRSDSGGRFRTRLNGKPLRLFARAWADGTAGLSLSGLDDGTGDVDLGDVTLLELGTLDGRAVLRDGRPASGVLVVAAQVEHGTETLQARQHVHHLYTQVDEPEDGLGSAVGRSTSDEQAAFHMAGLAPGAYVVYAVS